MDEAIAARLTRLERSLQRTQRLAVGLALVLGLLLTTAAIQDPAKAVPEVLTVKKLVADQVEVGSAGTAAKASSILTVHGDVSVLGSEAVYGMLRVLKPSDPTVAPAEQKGCLIHDRGILLGDKDGKDGFVMTAISAGAVHVATASGWDARLQADSQGGSIGIGMRKDGLLRDRVALTAVASESTRVVVSDPVGRERAVLGNSESKESRNGVVSKYPESTLILWSEDGKMRFIAPQ